MAAPHTSHLTATLRTCDRVPTASPREAAKRDAYNAQPSDAKDESDRPDAKGARWRRRERWRRRGGDGGRRWPREKTKLRGRAHTQYSELAACGERAHWVYTPGGVLEDDKMVDKIARGGRGAGKQVPPETV